MSKLKLVAVAAVLIGAAAYGGLTAGERFGGRPDIDAIRAGNTAGNDASVGDVLLGLLARGREQTGFARYQVKSQDSQMSSGNFTISLWRKPPRVRQDSFSQVDGRTVYTAAFRDTASGPVVRCTKYDNDPWGCTSAMPAHGEFDALVETVRSEIRGNRVVEFEPDNSGRAVRCFRIESVTPMEICVTGAGIPTRISSGDSRLELLELNGNVKDGDFTPPAPLS